jgi:serine O-acetyltransferase
MRFIFESAFFIIIIKGTKKRVIINNEVLKMKLTKPIQNIRDSYKEVMIKKDHCSCRIPQADKVEEIIELTREVIFPGYFSDSHISEVPCLAHTKRVVRKLHKLLKTQIQYSLLYLADAEKSKELKKKSCTLCVDFINKIPEIRKMAYYDAIAHFNGDPAAFNLDQVVISYPGLYAITVYRIAHCLDKIGVQVIPRMMSEYAHRVTGIDINPRAEIGECFFIDHGTGVVIGETAVIGKNVKIYQGVTLGAMSLRKGQQLKGTKRHPTIEDDVTIYANASILGGDTIIGANSVIGSNVFITKSVPKNMVVTTKEPELVLRENKKNGTI